MYELSPRGIDVTVAKPGFFKTKFVRGNSFLPFLMTPEEVASKILKAVEARDSYIIFPKTIHLILVTLNTFLSFFPNTYHRIVKYWHNNARRKMNKSLPSLDLEKEDKMTDLFGWKRIAFGLLPSFLAKKLFKIK